jgi:dTDP-4-amino-4,6-dideoxygalactose transaminase
MEKIYLSPPHMGGNELQFVQDAFNSNWIAPLGANVDGFEKDLESFLGDDVHVVALSSGTAALHLSLIMLGVTHGDEVLCQSMTFSASANPIVYQGAVPVFIGSEKDTWNMSPEFLEEAIKESIASGKKPKAIIPVHLYGMPAKMDAISQIAERYDIPVIEDAAEALGSHINGKKAGTFGKMAALSFNGNKIITTSGGGALVTHDKELADKTRFLSTQARDNAPHYEHSNIGYNYRMSNIVAGIGRGQMMVLNDRVQQHRSNSKFYEEQLAGKPGIQFLPEPAGFYSNRWLTTILIDHAVSKNNITREDVRLALEKEEIESRPLWKPMHLQPVFTQYKYYGDDTCEKLFENGLCLPSGSALNSVQKQRIMDVLNELL